MGEETRAPARHKLKQRGGQTVKQLAGNNTGQERAA